MKGEQQVLVSEPVRRFFLTSGSTAAPKYIPVTSSFIRDKWRAFQTYWSAVFETHPGIGKGRIVTNFSDAGPEAVTAGGMLCSSESSFWASWSTGLGCSDDRARQLRSAVKIESIYGRYYGIARLLAAENVSGLMTLNPSTMLLLFQTIDLFADVLVRDLDYGEISDVGGVSERERDTIRKFVRPAPVRAARIRSALQTNSPRLMARDIWPGLASVICWRSPMLRGYLSLLAPYIGGIPQRDYISMASEGVIAIPLEEEVSGGVVAIDSHFLEFIPENCSEREQPDTLLVHELEPGQNYEVVLTTSNGLYRYRIGDVVQVREIADATPVVQFLYRTGLTCSMTGEKLTEDQVFDSVTRATERLGVRLAAFTLFPTIDPFPHYTLLVETADGAVSGDELAKRVDSELANRNLEYQAKRHSQRLGAVVTKFVKPGSYARWRSIRVSNGATEDQIKIPCLTRDSEFDVPFREQTLKCESAA